MNTSPILYIANMIYGIVTGSGNVRLRNSDKASEVLRIPLNDETFIVLTYNNEISHWVLVAERDVSHLPEFMRDQLLEKLMDTASHSRADEYLVVGLTASRKISVSKILVDVSVNKVIINAVERISSVIMTAKNEELVDGACVIDC